MVWRSLGPSPLPETEVQHCSAPLAFGHIYVKQEEKELLTYGVTVERCSYYGWHPTHMCTQAPAPPAVTQPR